MSALKGFFGLIWHWDVKLKKKKERDSFRAARRRTRGSIKAVYSENDGKKKKNVTVTG